MLNLYQHFVSALQKENSSKISEKIDEDLNHNVNHSVIIIAQTDIRIIIR